MINLKFETRLRPLHGVASLRLEVLCRDTQRLKIDNDGLEPQSKLSFECTESPVGSDMGRLIKHRRATRRIGMSKAPRSGMSKAELRELRRAAVERAKITVLPPGKKPDPPR
jgi:hypothetical protein